MTSVLEKNYGLCVLKIDDVIIHAMKHGDSIKAQTARDLCAAKALSDKVGDGKTPEEEAKEAGTNTFLSLSDISWNRGEHFFETNFEGFPFVTSAHLYFLVRIQLEMSPTITVTSFSTLIWSALRQFGPKTDSDQNTNSDQSQIRIKYINSDQITLGPNI